MHRLYQPYNWVICSVRFLGWIVHVEGGLDDRLGLPDCQLGPLDGRLGRLMVR